MKKIFFLLTAIVIISGIQPVTAQDNQFEAMIYTSPDRHHNATIPTAISELEEMSMKHQFGLSWTQLTSSFNDENLKGFDVIVFLHANGSRLSDEQKASLRNFIWNGGGFVGIHAASVNAGQDEWSQKLIGRIFKGHPEIQTGTMIVHDHNFPATLHLPDKWIWTDEWYAFGDALTPDQHVLITVDESSYDTYLSYGTNEFRGMGEFHPVAWYQYFDGGRSFFTAIGHMESAYRDPWFMQHLYGGIYWAATGKGAPK